uniref:Uncharacterized protein n=1 Tax=Guillardia theta TaxID=55529 RepID=A0A6U5VJQ8_GUITH|mmetsp:Transcript_10198/g.34012  ORF Transcript_10198/g.34012 Transcript_10198/m.34012 type:complete len:261 (+) Transcript_10198:36-818(+)
MCKVMIPTLLLLALASLQLDVVGSSSTFDAGAAEYTMLSGNDEFFRQAKQSISHDKRVLKRLESHPLAHASGWNIRETQSADNGWSEKAVPTGPAVGSRKWQKENDRLERQLEDMSNSVNTMFKDQNSRRKYRRDEDKLFNQAVAALKTADKLYPDTPASGGSGGSSNPDSGFAHDEGRLTRRARRGTGQGRVRMYRGKTRMSPGLRAWYNGPNLTEAILILMGCTLLAASGWVAFIFCRRKSYRDLRTERGRPEGIEVP